MAEGRKHLTITVDEKAVLCQDWKTDHSMTAMKKRLKTFRLDIFTQKCEVIHRFVPF